MQAQILSISNTERRMEIAPGSEVAGTLSLVSENTQKQLMRMFRDPNVLAPAERTSLIELLRDAVTEEPEAAGLRVLLAMVYCVDLQVQDGLEEMRVAVQLAPDAFLARLKLGELLMRLRVCSEAAEHTQIAAQLAGNAWESEMARKQAATIREMLREGIERGGYGKLRSVLQRVPKLWSRAEAGASMAHSSSR